MSQSSQSEDPTTNSKPTFDPSSYFERAASTYEETSDIMKEIASHLLALSPPLTSQSIIHDNAAGPGIVTGQILALPQFTNAEPPTIHATDYSPAMIRALTARSQSEGWPHSAIHAQVMDSTDLSPLPSNTFTHTYMAAAIFIVPEPVKAIREIHRTLAPTGVALITTFEKQGSMAPFQDVQRAVRPDLPLWNGPLPAEWLTESKLRDVMQAGGFAPEKVKIKRHSAWLSGEAWSKPGMMPLREALARSITSGWSDGDREVFEKKLQEEMQSERVKNARYEMKIFVAVARK